MYQQLLHTILTYSFGFGGLGGDCGFASLKGPFLLRPRTQPIDTRREGSIAAIATAVVVLAFVAKMGGVVQVSGG